MRKRIFDIFAAAFAIALFALPMLVVAALVKLTSPGPVLYWSDRVGRDNRLFRMPKFRTMRTNAPVVATHLLTDADRWITPLGRFLRSSSLDELPQLWNVLTGEMSFVGPRPALFNQLDLVALRTERGLHRLTPGLTGWAQINGRDELAIPEKVAFDDCYRQHASFAFDLSILARTVAKVLRREGIRQATTTIAAAPETPCESPAARRAA